jgi:tryptophanyl-tRNA synthetase
MQKERLLTGLQPTGELHIGNYFGALKPFVDEYEKFESFLLVVDYHALTTIRDPKELKKNTLQVAIDYIAAGVDPEKVTMFEQSKVPEHMELAWIFECLVTVPFLMQAHAYKDKVAKGIEATAGLFNYPMLMAADILLYDAEVIPVGEDQRQHIEYAREAVGKFHNSYGETFKTPKEVILTNVGTVPGTDGQKMSKSYRNTIPLFASKDEISKAVMGIVTDSEGGIPENVFAIHKLYKEEGKLKDFYNSNLGNNKAIKEALIQDIEEVIAPMRTKRTEIMKDKTVVRKALDEGKNKARIIAEAKMAEIRKKIGLNL